MTVVDHPAFTSQPERLETTVLAGETYFTVLADLPGLWTDAAYVREIVRS